MGRVVGSPHREDLSQALSDVGVGEHLVRGDVVEAGDGLLPTAVRHQRLTTRGLGAERDRRREVGRDPRDGLEQQHGVAAALDPEHERRVGAQGRRRCRDGG